MATPARPADQWRTATTGPSRVNLDKLVRRICLDIALLKWFATTGGRKVAALSAIGLARADSDHAVLDFLERHIGGTS